MPGFHYPEAFNNRIFLSLFCTGSLSPGVSSPGVSPATTEV